MQQESEANIEGIKTMMGSAYGRVCLQAEQRVSRLVELFSGALKHKNKKALDAHDIARGRMCC
jgi:hypothetical protein